MATHVRFVAQSGHALVALMPAAAGKEERGLVLSADYRRLQQDLLVYIPACVIGLLLPAVGMAVRPDIPLLIFAMLAGMQRPQLPGFLPQPTPWQPRSCASKPARLA